MAGHRDLRARHFPQPRSRAAARGALKLASQPVCQRAWLPQPPPQRSPPASAVRAPARPDSPENSPCRNRHRAGDRPIPPRAVPALRPTQKRSRVPLRKPPQRIHRSGLIQRDFRLRLLEEIKQALPIPDRRRQRGAATEYQVREYPLRSPQPRSPRQPRAAVPRPHAAHPQEPRSGTAQTPRPFPQNSQAGEDRLKAQGHRPKDPTLRRCLRQSRQRQTRVLHRLPFQKHGHPSPAEGLPNACCLPWRGPPQCSVDPHQHPRGLLPVRERGLPRILPPVFCPPPIPEAALPGDHWTQPTLPRPCHASSDSPAAQFASFCKGAEGMLLKRCLPPMLWR